jgi:hypothetical protein
LKTLFISAIFISANTYAASYKEIYPFKHIEREELTSRIKYLSESEDSLYNLFTIHAQGLSVGETKNRPWSGPYWALKEGMVANPYLERSIFHLLHFLPLVDDIRPYEKRKNYVLTRESQLTEKELAKLSPAEKYDMLLGNNLDLSSRVWDFINKWKEDMKWNYVVSIDYPQDDFELEKKNYIVANWEGICHGWAPASGVVPRPQKTVVVNLPDGRRMPFYPEDIKGLISLTWANSLIQDNVRSEGFRCKRRFPKSDRFGRYYDTIAENGVILPRCADVHPAVLHLVLVNLVGRQGRSFIIDRAAKIAVANQPVISYRFDYFNPDTGKDGFFNRALISYDSYRFNDPFFESRHPDTKYLIGVQSTIVYADWTMIKKPKSKNYLTDKTNKLVSLYDLELDERGNIVGGQWRGLKNLNNALNPSKREFHQPVMNTDRPDFLWIVPKNYKSYFRPVSGLEEWDIRSGKKPPESWTKASISAHSFMYENSKYFGNYELCKVRHKKSGETREVPCEFKYPRPQPLLQVINQLIEYSSL